MSRYIDAEELKHIVNSSKYYGTKRQRDFCDMITETPAVDVEPVRHGHWECSDDIYETAICSECGCDTEESYGFVINSDEYNFCRNCGAKMDEWEQNHEVQKV